MRKKLIFTAISLSLITILLVFFFANNKRGMKDISLLGKKITTNGKVIDFSPNPHFDIDGIILQINNEKINLRFPPHIAGKILQIVKKGDQVTAIYSEEYHPFEKENIGRLISVTDKDKSFSFEDYRPEPPNIQEGKPTSILIKNYRFNIDDRDNPNAILADNYYIDVRPHILKDISSLMKNGSNIEVTGVLRNEFDGFVNYYGYKFLKAESIKIDDKTYLLR